MTQPKANVHVDVPASPAVGRRQVFIGAGAVGALAAVAVSLPRGEQATPAAQPAQSGKAEGGYQLTEHVLRYYQTARV